VAVNFERLGPEAAAREALIMGLRLVEGWDRAAFRIASGFDWRDLRGDAIARLVRQGLLLETTDRLRLTPETFFISNVVFTELV